jgi:hypothetical protein
MTRLAALGVLVAAMFNLGGCSNDRLVFASTESLGVKLAINTADTNPLTINLGYNSYNATLIPTTYANGQKALLANNGLCVVDDGKELAKCLEAAHIQNPEAVASKIESELSATVKELGSDMSGVQMVVAVDKNKLNNISDSLTTFSSFDTSVFASTGSANSGGIKLGRVFATGVGAQFVSQGAAKLEEARGRAECVEKLASATGGVKVDPAVALALCGPWMIQVKDASVAQSPATGPAPGTSSE